MQNLSVEEKTKLDQRVNAFIQMVNMALVKDGNLVEAQKQLGSMGDKTIAEINLIYTKTLKSVSQYQKLLVHAEKMTEALKSLEPQLANLQADMYTLQGIKLKLENITPSPLFSQSGLYIKVLKDTANVKTLYVSQTEQMLVKDIKSLKSQLNATLSMIEIQNVEKQILKELSKSPVSPTWLNTKPPIGKDTLVKDVLDKALRQVEEALDSMDKKAEQVDVYETIKNATSKLEEKIQGVRQSSTPTNNNTPAQPKQSI